jgi:hypothetical protein
VLGRLTGPAVAAEIRRCRAALIQATGGGRYFRPSGRTRPTPLVLAEAGAAGYPQVPSTSTRATAPTPARTRSPPSSRRGCGPARSWACTPATPAPSPRSPPILVTARARGLQPVRLQQLLAATPSAP